MRGARVGVAWPSHSCSTRFSSARCCCRRPSRCSGRGSWWWTSRQVPVGPAGAAPPSGPRRPRVGPRPAVARWRARRRDRAHRPTATRVAPRPRGGSTASSSARSGGGGAFRALDQEAGRRDRAGDGASPASSTRSSSPQLAIEETGFGVFEDKVVKNYIATEFLYDYLQGQALGRRDRRGRRARHPVRRRADRRRAGAPADHQPDVDRAVQGDRRGQDAQRDDLPARRARAARCAERAVEILQEAGEAAGLPPGALQVDPRPDARRLPVPLPPPAASTSSGPPAARRPSPRPTRPASRASASGPATRRSTCTAAPTSRWPSSTS